MNKLRLFFLSRRSWTLPYLIFSIIFVIVPLLLIVVYAFTDDAGRMTLENFRKFLAHPDGSSQYLYLFHRYSHTDYDRLYRTGVSGGLDSEPQ